MPLLYCLEGEKVYTFLQSEHLLFQHLLFLTFQPHITIKSLAPFPWCHPYRLWRWLLGPPKVTTSGWTSLHLSLLYVGNVFLILQRAQMSKVSIIGMLIFSTPVRILKWKQSEIVKWSCSELLSFDLQNKIWKQYGFVTIEWPSVVSVLQQKRKLGFPVIC